MHKNILLKNQKGYQKNITNYNYMIVYQSNKKGFIEDVISNEIDTKIKEAYIKQIGRRPSDSEANSWSNSMLHMNNVLLDNEIDNDLGVSIEFQIPMTSKRIDFILTGIGEDLRDKVVVIELKQWQHVQLTDKDAMVKTKYGFGTKETVHPSYQAWTYALLLENYNSTIQDYNIELVPCAYLHNYSDDGIITNQFYQEYIEKAPLFFKNDSHKLRSFIKDHLKKGDKNEILYKIEHGRIRPSKHLADTISEMIKGNTSFFMIDEQKLVFETAIKMCNNSLHNGEKKVLIVEGGPGTGKSVVAVNLLSEFTKRELLAKYISKNAAPREVYASKLSGSFKKSFINNLFGGSGAFYDIENNIYDVLIVDEAHRLNLKSGLYQNIGENQISEIIDAAKFSIFFIDNDQRIHVSDIGSKEYISQIAKQKGISSYNLKLESQFRCNGSDGYLAWLDNMLQIRETANFRLSSEDYDFKIFEDPKALLDAIKEKNKINNKSRMVAGYCWDWKSKKDNNQYDVVIDEFDFRMKWNLTEDGSKWIISEKSIDQIGCIHTCQGLELDYVGVIVGNDISYNNGLVITDVTKRSTNDMSVKGLRTKVKIDDDEGIKNAERIIKNTYRTLMTRGIKGCYVYFCDHNLKEYFYKNISTSKAVESIRTDIHDVRIEKEVAEWVKYVDYLPFYSVKAACGNFGDGEIVNEEGWVKVEGFGKLNRNMFVVRAKGNSMQPKICDGELCVFRTNVVGSRNGKIVLVKHESLNDPDYGSYTIKLYKSEKTGDNIIDSEWYHQNIILEPLNKEYNTILLNEYDTYIVVGEFCGVVDSVK